MQKFGIDLSHHNAGINFDVLKNSGVEFAILRAGYTGYGDGVSKAKDNQFENFYNQCKARGIGVGAYWFSCANTYQKGVDEANWMYENCLKGKQFDYPIYTDVEDDTGGRQWLRKAGRERITDGICGFCDRMEQLGYYVGIYANVDWFNNWINQSRVVKFDKWLASWSRSKPATALSNRIWQFGGETNYQRSPILAGQTVDQDYCYYDYPAVIKNAGLNGYPKGSQPTPQPTPTKKTNEELANEVIAGKWGNGEERKQRLTSAGYNYQAVQDIVNAKLGIKPSKTLAVGTKVKTIKTGNGASDGSSNRAKSGVTGTITRIKDGANYPYLVSNGDPIGWYKADALQII